MASAARDGKAQLGSSAQPSRSVVLGVAVSLDGYIARTDGRVDWLKMDRKFDFAGYLKTYDVVLAGRKTLDPESGRRGGGAFKMACYIFSRTRPPGRKNGAEYVNRPPGELVRELKARPGKDIWLMGGGELAREFLKEDVVDRMDLGIIPTLLGDGIPLFPRGFPQREFALKSVQAYPSGIVMASYERTHPVARRSQRGKRSTG
jgi:dihydrofolate reductase